MSRAPNPITATVVLSVAALAIYGGVHYFAVDAADTAAAQTPALRVPDLAMPDLDGVETSLRNWPGQPMIVNFWATWCAPCLREIPMLMSYQAEHTDVQIVGIGVDSEDAVQDFAAENPFSYPVLVGPRGYEAAAAFGAEYLALPLTAFTAADGRVLSLHMGEVEPAQLERFTAAIAGLADGSLDFAAAADLVEAH